MDWIDEDDLIVMSAAAIARAVDGDRDVNDACQRIATTMALNTGNIVVKRRSGELSPAVRAAIANTREMLMRMIISQGGMA